MGKELKKEASKKVRAKLYCKIIFDILKRFKGNVYVAGNYESAKTNIDAGIRKFSPT